MTFATKKVFENYFLVDMNIKKNHTNCLRFVELSNEK